MLNNKKVYIPKIIFLGKFVFQVGITVRAVYLRMRYIVYSGFFTESLFRSDNVFVSQNYSLKYCYYLMQID